MSLLPGITSGLRSLLRRKRVGQELDEELSAFLEMAAEEKMKQRHKPQRGTSRSATGTGSLEVTKEAVCARRWRSR